MANCTAKCKEVRPDWEYTLLGKTKRAAWTVGQRKVLQAASSRPGASGLEKDTARLTNRAVGWNAVWRRHRSAGLHRVLFFDSSSQSPVVPFKASTFSKQMTQNPPASCYEQKGVVGFPSAVLTALHTQAGLNSISSDEPVPAVWCRHR